MDFDASKENIQPLRGGRRAELLELALHAEGSLDAQKELLEQRQAHERAITEYDGDDPLSIWCEYIYWIEQTYLKSGKEADLESVLIRCIQTFENDPRYRQDRRMVKIYIKYIDRQPNPQNYYQELYNQGIGTMVADLYIGWAYYYDAIDNFKKTEEIYRKGLDAGAQPLDELKQAHVQFGFTMSQKTLYKDEPEVLEQLQSSLAERRTALTSLRAHRQRLVGTTRTGAAVVRSHNPGTVNQENISQHSTAGNIPLQVYQEEQETVPRNESVVKSLVDNARARENQHEPGPWTKAKLGKSGPLFPMSTPTQPSFPIAEDEGGFTPIPYAVKNYHLGFIRPESFVSCNKPQDFTWAVPIAIVDETDRKGLPRYPKTYLYPKPNQEYCPEELRAYRYFKKRNITNKFTTERDSVWEDRFEVGARLPPGFARKNDPQPPPDTLVTELPPIDKNCKLMCRVPEMFASGKEELSMDEALAAKWKNKAPKQRLFQYEHDTEDDDIVMDDSDCAMEETIIGKRRVSYHPLKLNTSPAPPPTPQLASTPPNKPDHLFAEPFAVPKKIVKPRDSLALYLTKRQGVAQDQHQSEASSVEAIKRKVEESPQVSTSKSRCTIDTPEKFKEAPPTVPPPASTFNDFAVPEPRVKKAPIAALTPVNSFPIYQDDEAVGGKDDELPAPTSCFNLNESCSTQNFSLFLKAQSVSTPIQKVKALSRITPSESVEVKPDPPVIQDENESPTPPPPSLGEVATDDAPPQYTVVNFTCQQKKLSTIMETSENTNSTGAHTKSSISSPDSETEVTTKGKSQVVNATASTLSKSKNLSTAASMADKEAVLTRFEIFDEREEDLQNNDSGLKAPINQSKNASGAIPKETSLAFKIFEDKTENIERPHVGMLEKQNTLVINETLPQDASGIKAPTKEPCLAFQIFEDKTETMLARPQPLQKLPPAILFNESKIDKENRLMSATVCQSPTICDPELSTTEYPNFNETPPKQRDVSILPSFKFDDTQPTNNPLVSFEVEAAKPAVFDIGGGGNQADNNIDLDAWATSPTKKIPAMKNRSTQSLASLIQFDTNEKNSTQSLLKMNVEDSKQISMLAQAPEPTPLLQIKQVDDQQFSFRPASPFAFKSPDLPMPKLKLQPIFIEDDQINTQKFNPNLENIQNSTLISPPISAATNSLVPFTLPIEVKPTTSFTTAMNKVIEQTAKLSVSLNEDELMNFVKTPEPVAGGPKASLQLKKPEVKKLSEAAAVVEPSLPDDFGKSIYLDRSNSIEGLAEEDWDDSEHGAEGGYHDHDDKYMHSVVNLNETNALIGTHLNGALINPFDRELITAFLEKINILDYIEQQAHCELRKKIQPMKSGQVVTCARVEFEIVKAIGKGAFGSVFKAKGRSDGKIYAMKQERPANLWEYYICQEIGSRLQNTKFLPGFMQVEYAIIANNASILISKFSPYGTLIDVCNKFKASTGRNLNENIVMIITCQILAIIDHLHAMKIIHADIKPDNFLLMEPLSFESSKPAVQLIDFGISIDMELMTETRDVTFKQIDDKNPCIEMREGKPWTYQVDLYGVAGTVHAMLFGKYMEVEKKTMGWQIKNKFPRYMNKAMWELFFSVLLNIRSCKEIPDLQDLKRQLIEEMMEHEKECRDQVQEFNKTLKV